MTDPCVRCDVTSGKTTLLRLLAGLTRPTAGEVAVLGGTPRQDPAFLADIGFLAQEIPLYRRSTAADHIDIGAHLNPRWDAASAFQGIFALLAVTAFVLLRRDA